MSNTWAYAMEEDSENWTACETKEEAIAEGENYLSEWTNNTAGEFFIAPIIPGKIPNVDVDMIIETLQEEAFEEGGDYAEDWLRKIPDEKIQDLSTQLNNLVKNWIVVNGYEPDWFTVGKPEMIEVEEK
jgi:hypothetical protein